MGGGHENDRGSGAAIPQGRCSDRRSPQLGECLKPIPRQLTGQMHYQARGVMLQPLQDLCQVRKLGERADERITCVACDKPLQITRSDTPELVQPIGCVNRSREGEQATSPVSPRPEWAASDRASRGAARRSHRSGETHVARSLGSAAARIGIGRGSWNHIAELGGVVCACDLATSEICECVAEHCACVLSRDLLIRRNEGYDLLPVEANLAVATWRTRLPCRISQESTEMSGALSSMTLAECAGAGDQHSGVHNVPQAYIRSAQGLVGSRSSHRVDYRVFVIDNLDDLEHQRIVRTLGRKLPLLAGCDAHLADNRSSRSGMAGVDCRRLASMASGSVSWFA